MKTILFIIAVFVSCMVALSWSCEKGCESYQGACACLGTPETAPVVKPSDEKPPRSGMAPEHRGEIVDMPANLYAPCGHKYSDNDGLRRYCKPCRQQWHREYYRKRRVTFV